MRLSLECHSCSCAVTVLMKHSHTEFLGQLSGLAVASGNR